MDGIPALDLKDVVIEVLRSSNNVPNQQPIRQQETAHEVTNPNPNKRETEMLKRKFFSRRVSVVHL